MLKNPDFPRPLVEIRNLLRQVHAHGHADTADSVLDLLLTDSDEAMRVLTGLTFWGGSGSFADLIIARGNGHVSGDYERDNKTYKTLLLELFTNIKAEGYDTGGRLPP